MNSLPTHLSDAVVQARTVLAQAEHVACLTGAGISAESGIPTFRDCQTGLWAHFDPEDLASAAGFRRNPPRVWQWYRDRWKNMQETAPNAGHRALVELAGWLPRFDIITQNVDDLHEKAGHDTVWHLHGELGRFRCLDCRRPYAPAPVELTQDTPPPCPRCQGLIRPDVVWFGEMLDPAVLERAYASSRACDVMLVVGTSGMVWPASDLPCAAQAHGACLIEVNPQSTLLSAGADICLPASAGQVLPLLCSQADDTAGPDRNIGPRISGDA